MGYECPVCGIPQADGGHLANHVAFTAIIHGDEHEEWLEEHVTDWSDRGEAELADVVVEYAEQTEFPQLFEDTTGSEHHHDQERSGQLFDDEVTRGGRQQNVDAQPAALDAEAQSILEEARQLTEEKRDEE